MKKILFILFLTFVFAWFLSISYLDFYFIYNSIDILNNFLISFLIKIFYLVLILLWIYYFFKNNFLKNNFKYVLVSLWVFIFLFTIWMNSFSKMDFLKYSKNPEFFVSSNINNENLYNLNYKYNFSNNFSNIFFDNNEYNYFYYLFIKNNAWEINKFLNYKISFLDTLLSKEKLYLKKVQQELKLYEKSLN